MLRDVKYAKYAQNGCENYYDIDHCVVFMCTLSISPNFKTLYHTIAEIIIKFPIRNKRTIRK